MKGSTCLFVAKDLFRFLSFFLNLSLFRVGRNTLRFYVGDA